MVLHITSLLSSAPTGLSPPKLHPVNETAIQIDWDPPAQLNGPPPLYQVCGGVSYFTLHLETFSITTLHSNQAANGGFFLESHHIIAY